MKEGVPIIYQGILHNYNNKTFGAPDLMIRNDYLNKFIGYDLYNDTSPSKILDVSWHYVIVDIKHSVYGKDCKQMMRRKINRIDMLKLSLCSEEKHT